MNVRIGHLFGLVVLLFGLLVGFTSYWSVFDAHGLETNAANKRLLLEEQRIRRGLIFARDGTVLARNKSTGRGSSRFYHRTYPTANLFSHAVGYSYIQLGRAGIERSHNDQLTGKSNEFKTVFDELRGKEREGDDLRTAWTRPASERQSRLLPDVPGRWWRSSHRPVPCACSLPCRTTTRIASRPTSRG